MISPKQLHFLFLCLALSISSCTKLPEYSDKGILNQDPSFVHSNFNQDKTDPGIIQRETTIIDRSYSVEFPAKRILDWNSYALAIDSPYKKVDNMIDLHLEILPLYVFGTENSAGDYYAINGYVVSHNASAFQKRNLNISKVDPAPGVTPAEFIKDSCSVAWMGWFMSDFAFDFQLLDDKGNAVNNQDVNFFVQPEPSTTIGSTTYTKGFSFTLAPSLTFGAVKKMSGEEEKPSWKTTLLGVVGLGFNSDNKSTQNLPDQSVMMWTGPQDRTVNYDFVSNNIGKKIDPEAIPTMFRNDQRVDFSWVWYVKSGSYAAKDYCFDNMKMKVSIHPKYKSFAEGDAYVWVKEVDKNGKEHTERYSRQIDEFNIEADNTQISVADVLPAINRIPTGTFTLKNCTRSYLSNIKIYRTGEFGTGLAYSSVDGTCDTNESVQSILREGTYDFFYELFNGDTGESRGVFFIEGVEIKSNTDKTLTTFDGKRK